MRIYVRDPDRRRAARSEFIADCARIERGLRPKRVFETDIYVTRRCNLQCSYCYFREYFAHPQETLPKDTPFELLKLQLDKIDGKTYCLVVLGGEPFSRCDFQKILEYARYKDIYSIRVSTNGLYLKQKIDTLHLIDRITVSFDCTRSAQYPERMKELLNDIVLVQAKLKYDLPRLCLAWTTGPADVFEKDVRPLLDYAIAHGFEVKFLPVKTNRKADWDSHKRLVNQALLYAPPGVVTNDPAHTSQLSLGFLFKNCLQGVQYYIDPDGNFLYPCDEFPEQKAGSIYEHSLDELYNIALDKFGAYPRENTVCSNCPSGCHSDNSYILRNPATQLTDLL